MKTAAHIQDARRLELLELGREVKQKAAP